MIVRCESVNYYTRVAAGPDNQPRQSSAAQVSFRPIDENVEAFSIHLIGLEGNVDYFPNKIYELTINPVEE